MPTIADVVVLPVEGDYWKFDGNVLHVALSGYPAHRPGHQKRQRDTGNSRAHQRVGIARAAAG